MIGMSSNMLIVNIGTTYLAHINAFVSAQLNIFSMTTSFSEETNWKTFAKTSIANLVVLAMNDK